MADRNNPGQFGNRPDTQEQASKGGKSQGHRNSNPGNLANRSEQDRKRTARKGGEASHGGGRSENM